MKWIKLLLAACLAVGVLSVSGCDPKARRDIAMLDSTLTAHRNVSRKWKDDVYEWAQCVVNPVVWKDDESYESPDFCKEGDTDPDDPPQPGGGW